MATYYVDGVNGADGDNGLTWGTAKKTLNGAEDIPVAAGDTVYVGPGVYRELLTVDVSGNAGNSIAYIADVTGEHTDGVGGAVRVTGSDNDQSVVRTYCISAATKTHRVFRGFRFDLATQLVLLSTSCTDWIIEDCSFTDAAAYCIRTDGDSQASITIRRSVFAGAIDAISFSSAGGIQNAECLIENCIFISSRAKHIGIDDIGGITIRNSHFFGGDYGVRVTDSPPVGYTANTVSNCVFVYFAGAALRAEVLGEIVENVNTFWLNQADRTNVDTGASSLAYPPLLALPLLHSGASQASGFRFPWWFGDLSEWSQIRAIAGSNEPDEDLWGIQRPVHRSKRSWGPCQFQDVERETTTTRGASAASLGQRSPARQQMWVPTSNVQTTVSTYVYREPGYSSITNPQMIIKQPGQADRVTTDAGAASAWNLLTDTFTPAANPPYIVVELASHHQATSTSLSTSTSTSITSTSTSITSTSTSITSTSTSTTSTSVSTSTTSTSISTTTLAFDVYYDDLGVS